LPQPFATSARLSAIALAVSATIASTQAHPTAPPKTYHDPQYGVSFQYPATWNFDLGRVFYDRAQILFPDRRPLANVGIGGVQKSENNLYPNTDLVGVQFVYLVLPETTAQQCQKEAQGDEEAKITQEIIQGVKYRHLSTGNAGLCHQADEQIYAAYRGGRCYLFEAAVETMCPDAIGATRDITPAEIDTVKKQLRQVMQSVSIEDSQK
jgi:hypothetical protein